MSIKIFGKELATLSQDEISFFFNELDEKSLHQELCDAHNQLVILTNALPSGTATPLLRAFNRLLNQAYHKHRSFSKEENQMLIELACRTALRIENAGAGKEENKANSARLDLLGQALYKEAAKKTVLYNKASTQYKREVAVACIIGIVAAAALIGVMCVAMSLNPMTGIIMALGVLMIASAVLKSVSRTLDSFERNNQNPAAYADFHSASISSLSSPASFFPKPQNQERRSSSASEGYGALRDEGMERSQRRSLVTPH